jgi:hypothetical protein
MAGLVPAIHADPLPLTFKQDRVGTAWMAGSSPAMTMMDMAIISSSRTD